VTPPAQGARWFLLQAADPNTGCPALEARFLVADLARLREIIGEPANKDPELEWIYPLESERLVEIERSFGASLASDEHEATLVPWHSLREAPYLIHTGFELALMLEGRKPFAKFANHYPSEWFDELIGRFDPFVEEGRIVRRILTRPFPEPGCSSNGDVLEGVRDVYFALPGQEWRIDAYLLLCEVGSKAGWSDALVHYEGSLLGYEDWQNDWWIERSHRRLPGGWTRVLQSNELPTTIVGRQGERK
jgi:hypothetical protein